MTHFDQFWSAYPRKVGRIDARKAWGSTAKARPPLDELLAGLEQCKVSHQWNKEGGAFIPYPAKWLRRGGWEDRLAPEAKAVVAPQGPSDPLERLKSLAASHMEKIGHPGIAEEIRSLRTGREIHTRVKEVDPEWP